MARKINGKLIERMRNGDLVPLLNFLKTNNEKLRLEVRQAGKAFVYYKKCKILELGLNSYSIDEKYFENNSKPTDIKNQVINNPELYFKQTLSVVDSWLQKHKKQEFETQQNIAINNQEKDDKYIILDMEYNFSQKEIKERVKRAGFDLLGMDRKTGKIVFFEVKKGLKALTGKAGIETHIKDFEKFIYKHNEDEFRKNLIVDIQNIVSNKKELGLLENFDLPTTLSIDDIDLVFVFEPLAGDKDDYSKIYKEEHRKSASLREFRTIYVSENNLKLI
ncbi:MAG: hypothetical protein WCJ03_09125 [Bacteroidales bacterium]